MLRVLIAEDESLLAYTLRLQLEGQGCQVVGIAENGEAAVALCRSERPDVVLMDVRMPGLNGLEATRRIMEESPTCVVMLTANDEEDQVMQAEAAGATAYLVKPVNTNQILPAIELARRRFQDSLGLRKEMLELQEALEQNKLVEKAKALIMQRSGLSEKAAIQRLERLAKQKDLPLGKVAKKILAATGLEEGEKGG
jgi:two-component system, response regulator PdtaR